MKKILGLTLVAMLGCNGDKNTTDTEAASSSGSTGDASGTTAATATTPTTGGATDNSGSGGMTEAGSSGTVSVTDGTGDATTGDATTGDATTGGATTGGATTGGGGEFMAECQAVCDLANTCKLNAGPDCVQSCMGEFMGAMGACAAAIDGYLGCLASMSCMELGDLFQNDNPGPCADEVVAGEAACAMGGGDCTIGIDGNPQGTECSLSKECQGEPVLGMQCAMDQCVCLVDGMEVGNCTADMICKTQDQLEVKAADCCGF